MADAAGARELQVPTVVTAATRMPPRIRSMPGRSPSPVTCASSFLPGGSPQHCEEIHVVTAKVRPPRPRIAPGTPLLSHRNASPTPRSRPSSRGASATPRSRPTSACRSSSPFSIGNGKITVYIYSIHTADKIALQVHPDIRIGEDSSLHDKVHSAENGDTANGNPSLKVLVAKICAVDASQIRFIFCGTPLGSDDKTLRCYGVNDGDTVQLRLRRLSAAAQCEGHSREIRKDEDAGMRPYLQMSASARTDFERRCADNCASVMPKWVSQEHPGLFAPVGAGLDGHGGDRAFARFCEQGIWTPAVDHVNHRGQTHYGLQRVRESVVARGGA
eukprot:TRINITY_DN7977_c0_g1_i2.p1 TRINITY_DN7977_c0_g1~~TRINITY_DN7977_c0_g1_i2.p1  ORF type:complete len:372 (-),score=30.14 TRINITY_DN7977_c0_g1_i2:208-1200(-)